MVVAHLIVALAAVAWPATMRWLAAKEGPLEHLSHLVVAAAGTGFFRVGIRAAARGRAIALGMACFCGIVLGEELGWGSVLGVEVVADAVRAISGRSDFHNAWSGASYLLFAVPVVALFGPVLLASVGIRGEEVWVHRWQEALGDVAPAPDHALALACLGVASLTGTLAVPDWESELDEITELLLYAVLAVLAWRRPASA